MQLLPLITWIINTILTSALPRNSILYKVWFGRQLLADFQEYKVRAILGGNSEELGEGLEKELGEELEEEDIEEGLFINKDIKIK